MRIDKNGNVGIGTASPDQLLHVAGRAVIDGELGLGYILRMNGGPIALNGNWLSGDGHAEGIFVNSGGNVGIGAADPDYLLTVGGSATVRGDFRVFSRLLLRDGNIALGGNWISSDGENEGVFVGGDGNVGIGAADPDYLLTVGGDAAVRGDFRVFSHLLMHGGNIALRGHWLSGDGEVEGVFVRDDGRVGIGTSNPQANLDVAGTINATAITVNGQPLTCGEYEADVGGGGDTSSLSHSHSDLAATGHSHDLIHSHSDLAATGHNHDLSHSHSDLAAIGHSHGLPACADGEFLIRESGSWVCKQGLPQTTCRGSACPTQ